MSKEKTGIRRLLTGTSANQMAFFNILGPVILNGVNFFTVPVFTRLLGAENYGVISLYHDDRHGHSDEWDHRGRACAY